MTPAWEQLEVIGTTTPARAGDLPCKMAPIYRDRLDHGRYFLPHAADAEGEIRLSPVEKWWIDDQIALGEVTIFSRAIQAQAGHCLLQMSADANPEYLPEKDAPARARRACGEALLLVLEALRRDERAEAERWAWYALRADRDQNSLLLVLIALLRCGNKEEGARGLQAGNPIT